MVFDSTWGNTEKVAHAVAAGIGGGTKVHRVGAVEAKRFDGIDLLVLGSPILGGRPSPSMNGFINSIPEATAWKLQVATFDITDDLTVNFNAPEVVDAVQFYMDLSQKYKATPAGVGSVGHLYPELRRGQDSHDHPHDRQSCRYPQDRQVQSLRHGSTRQEGRRACQRHRRRERRPLSCLSPISRR